MASDPIPEEELPPRLRFERLVKGPEPKVFKSVWTDPFAGDDDAEADAATEAQADADESARPTPPPAESDADILRRFEDLKEKLGQPTAEPPPPVVPRPPATHQPAATPSAPASVPPPSQARDEDTAGERETLEQLQARIREARREEREMSADPDRGVEAEGDDPDRLTYDELEDLKREEAKRRLREAKKEKRRERRKNRSFWQELPILVLVALVVAVIIKTFFFQAFYIPSGSMIPTLEINDRVLVNKLSYQFGAIERGDILVFDSPEAIEVQRSVFERVFRSVGEATGLTSPDTVLIKRVIGLPGETVEIRDNQVYVNDSPIAEPYLPEGVSMRDLEPLTVPADQVFMMGDNRNQSRDSRVFGPIPREDIVGRAFVTVWPPGAWGGL